MFNGVMPDWFYRTVAQRALFTLPDGIARCVALGVIGALGKRSVGRAAIEFMGHMTPDDRLAVSVKGVRFASPIGLGWRVDPERRATTGLSCFGVGCLEVRAKDRCEVRRTDGEMLVDGPITSVTQPATDAGVTLVERHHDGRDEWLRLPGGEDVPVFACDCPVEMRTKSDTGGAVLQVGSRGQEPRWTVPAAMPDNLPEIVRAWRRALPLGAPLIVSGGISRPRDAVALVQAGADLLLIDAGMVYRGPGLVRRCNEALLESMGEPEKPAQTMEVFRRAWFWTVALGVAMVAGGVAALVLALTRVLLPYDEHYLGLSSMTLERGFPRLFAFMAHDRATLAGVMLGLGSLYACLGWYGVRASRHGAKAAVIASALMGFASFFSFFGFGYFDTLHAFVAVVLFQITVQIMVLAEGGTVRPLARYDEENHNWRRAQWGQLLWVVHAVGLLFAGCLILGIGMTSVFVSEDLGFLCMTAEQTSQLGERMIAVIAHDRATLGGMLLASGSGMLLPVLWCFRRGEAWLWWAMVGLGFPAYTAALGIHFQVGYTDWRHMVPALVGLGLWLGGLFLSFRYLNKKEAS
jgi:dihydroorotate dehydrogenase